MDQEAKQQEFLSILKGLNENQARAVNTIEGPVLVLAGPGTGKTHILAARIGKILLETDALPHNILCMTFTEAGVLAMRRRLVDFIGPDAHKINIHTFHSFCNRVIRENLEIFGRQNLEPVSELEQMEILQELLNALPPDHPLRLGRGADGNYYINHLKALFSQMKSEDWTPSLIESRATQYLADLPNREEFIYKRNTKEFKKGDLKQAAFEKEEKRMKELVAGANLFPRFNALMEKYQRYDYNDMILWTLEAFKKNEWLLRNYQEQFLYILVDEFQDTNGAQNEVLQLLISYWEDPNLFIVGDDDQSIYEFQGARLKNLTDYYHQFKGSVDLIVLKNNYRSTQGILDASKNLIGFNDLRIINTLQDISIEKSLLASNKQLQAISTKPVLREYDYEFHELVHIVQELKALQTTGENLEEIAILYAKHRQADDLIKLLESFEIPYQVRKKTNILNLVTIHQLIEILNYLREELRLPYSGEHRLFKILHFECWGNSSNDLARITYHLARIEKEDRPFWRNILIDGNYLKEDIGLNEIQSLTNAGAVMNRLVGLVENTSLPHLVEAIFTQTGLLQTALESPDKLWRIQVLYSFMDFVKEECFRDPDTTLAGLLETLQSMDRHGISIDLEKDILAEKGVQLMTAHGSKGLEFKRVYLLHCTADYWEPGKSGNNYKFSIPDTLSFSGEEDAMEARRRLFFVAMTRAKEDLIMGYSLKKNETKEQRRARFLDELDATSDLQKENPVIPQAEITLAKAYLLQQNQQSPKENYSPEELDKLLEGFVLSITSFNKYIECPKSFFYEDVLLVPSLYSEAASYGSAMHRTLQFVFEYMLRNEEKQFPPLKSVIESFENELHRYKGYFSAERFELRLQSGKHHLEKIYEQWMPSWHKKVKLEYRTSPLEIQDVPVTGIIDKIEWDQNNLALLVDYKTSKPKPEHLSEPKGSQPYGGKYWRQLLFYQLLAEEDPRIQANAYMGQIAYLEPDTSGDYNQASVVFTSEWKAQMRIWIKEIYQKIMSHEFDEGCEKEYCVWCNFEKEKSFPDSLSNTAIEELDD
ncbi:MAG: ATP-dependent helicase [Saprospiraceae bacterium]|nr:ATP-dependent helicase [Saprospiraceae bacterium]